MKVEVKVLGSSYLIVLINNTQISILCFLYLFVEFMITMYEYNFVQSSSPYCFCGCKATLNVNFVAVCGAQIRNKNNTSFVQFFSLQMINQRKSADENISDQLASSVPFSFKSLYVCFRSCSKRTARQVILHSPLLSVLFVQFMSVIV